MDDSLKIIIAIAVLNVALITWIRVDLGRRIDDLRREVESRLDKIDTRLDKIDTRFDKVDNRFDRVDSELRDLHGRTARIEGVLERPPRRAASDPADHEAAA